MSPFANLLKTLRVGRGLRQFELAELVGYEQSYVSALELDIKGPPNGEFVAHLIEALQLSPIEQETLNEAVAASQRKINLPHETPSEVYWLFHKLRRQIDRLHPVQIQLIETALDLPAELRQPIHESPSRIRRRSSGTVKAEVKM